MTLKDITCGLGVSKLHGIGVFSLKNIKKGDTLYIGELQGEWYSPKDLEGLPPAIRKYLIEHWASILSNSDFIYPFDILTCYLNHSETPNYDARTDKALLDIKKGTEVLEDYGIYKDRLLTRKVV